MFSPTTKGHAMNITLTLTLDEDTLALLKKVLGTSVALEPRSPKSAKVRGEYVHGSYTATFLRMGEGETVKFDPQRGRTAAVNAGYWNKRYGSLIGMRIKTRKQFDGSYHATKVGV